MDRKLCSAWKPLTQESSKTAPVPFLLGVTVAGFGVTFASSPHWLFKLFLRDVVSVRYDGVLYTGCFYLSDVCFLLFILLLLFATKQKTEQKESPFPSTYSKPKAQMSQVLSSRNTKGVPLKPVNPNHHRVNILHLHILLL